MHQTIVPRKTRSRLIGLFAVGLFIAGTFSTALAQDWTQVTIDTNTQRTPYFLDTNVGFTFNAPILNEIGYVSIGNAYANLEKTSDGGFTWTHLRFFDSLYLTQLYFMSFQRGYAATLSGLYETIDQGENWKRISPSGRPYAGVYAAGGTLFATALDYSGSNSQQMGGNLYFSRNDGAIWDSITQVSGFILTNSLQFLSPQFQGIYGNRDSLVATVYFNDTLEPNGWETETYLVYSTNLGQSWQSSFLDSNYEAAILSLHISPHSCTIIRQSDNSKGNREYSSFMEASAPYTAWDSSLIDYPTFSWIEGNSCALYLCEGVKEIRDPAPFRRSTNNGLNWVPIDSTNAATDGPFDIDAGNWPNVSVVGYGAVVYATDNWRGLMKTTDGGDSTLSVGQLAPRVQFKHALFESGNDTLTVEACSVSSLVIYYQNLSCAITKLDSISIIGLPSSQYSLTTTHHNDCLSLPDTTIIILSNIAPGTYPLVVNANFLDDEYHSIDTSLHITLVVNSEGVQTFIRRENGSAYFGQIDSLPLELDTSYAINLDSLWPYLSEIQATYSWDSSVASYVAYEPPSGWMVSSVVNHGNTADIAIQNTGNSVPLDLGEASFRVHTSQNASSWVELPSLVLTVGTQSFSLCVTDNEDAHWLLSDLGETNSVTSTNVLADRDGIFLYPNPSKDILFVQNTNRSPSRFELYDAIGRLMMSETLSPSSMQQFDMEALVAGSYFAVFHTDGRLSFEKINKVQ